MSHAQLLALLLPPVSYDPNGARLNAELRAEGRALDRTEVSAATALACVTPLHAVDLLPDWERVCGLVPTIEATYAQRRDAVLAKLQEIGGLSIPHFISLAHRLGYAIQIAEFEPFCCDWSILDVDALYNDDVRWIWQVQVKDGATRMYPFAVDASCAGEALLAFSDPVIEEIFNDLKPAHTFLVFDYEEALSP